MAQLIFHVHPMGDAGAVGDHEGDSPVGFGLGQGLDGLCGVGSHGDLAHIDVAVGHGDLTQILLARGFASSCEFGDGRPGRRLRGLAARVRIHLGVHDEDVDVPSGSEDMVQAAESDVVCPTVTTNDPNARFDQSVGYPFESAGKGTVDAGQSLFELCHLTSLLFDQGVGV